MKVKLNLSSSSIQKAVDRIDKYSKMLEFRLNEFCVELANEGLNVAKSNTGTFNIEFLVDNQMGAVQLVGFSERELRVWYFGKKERKSNDYAPILMAEYGSGAYADEEHKGTFPTNHRARDVWSYAPAPDGVRIVTHGETPTRPMNKAYEEMDKKIVEVARRVFNKAI